MNPDPSSDLLEQLDRHLASPNLAWLLGAGISVDAGIPLMHPLTERVRSLLSGSAHEELLETVWQMLPEYSHIEHLLSNIADYIALAERSKDRSVNVGGASVTAETLREAHTEVVDRIALTIRWGYVPHIDSDNPERVGSANQPIIKINDHRAFVSALFNTRQAGLQNRRVPVRIFTTNYDTLLEDALSLESIPHWDGFSGGAVAFREHHFGKDVPSTGYRAHVIKLHGSIDWHLGQDGWVWRVRDGDTYPEREQRVLIYPQAAKYLATQRDPFAAQFELLRRTLANPSDNVLAVCGYSFGDDHINEEIEHAMGHPDSKTTLLAFCKEMPQCLQEWRRRPWGRRVYVAAQNGLYVGQEGPDHKPPAGEHRDWWKFSGLAKLLRDGVGSAS